MCEIELKRIPLIRFRAYHEAWKQYRLGEISNRITRKNTNLESKRPLTISAQYGLIDQNDFFNKQVASHDISGYYLMENGEFAYNKSYSKDYPFGAVKRLDKYEKGVLSTLYIVFEPKKVNSGYLAAYYDSFKWHKEISMRAAEGARNHGLLNIAPQDFFETQLFVPENEDEQEKIGRLFEQVDNIIALYQRELELLQLGKRMLLSKMFPKEGEATPEIRFRGFTGDWERHKVNDIALRFDNLRIPVASNLRISGTTPYYGANGIQDYVDGFTHEGEFVLIAEDGANDLKNYPVRCVGGRIWVNNHAHVLQAMPAVADNQFLAYALNQVDIETLLVGSGRAKLNAEVLMNIVLFLPGILEQRIIGECVLRLDNLVTLQQCKVSATKEIKKTLLKYMFV